MTVKELQRQNEIVLRNETVLRIRQLQDKWNQSGGLNSSDWSELAALQTEANANNWMYW